MVSGGKERKSFIHIILFCLGFIYPISGEIIGFCIILLALKSGPEWSTAFSLVPLLYGKASRQTHTNRKIASLHGFVRCPTVASSEHAPCLTTPLC